MENVCKVLEKAADYSIIVVKIRRKNMVAFPNDNGTYSFTHTTALSQEMFDKMDYNKDGRITETEKQLFDAQVRVDNNYDNFYSSDLEKLVFESKFKGSFIEDEETRNAYNMDISKKTPTESLKKALIKFTKGTSADDYLKNLGNDGVLTLDENKILMEVQEMEKIANDLIAQNNQYVIDSTSMGLIEQISDFFDSFVLKNKGRKQNIEKMSDEFASQLKAKFTNKNMAKAAISGLKDTDWLEYNLSSHSSWANRDGNLDANEIKEIQGITVDLLMARALQGESVEGILNELLEGVKDPNTKKQLVAAAKKLKELVGQELFKKPEDFFKEMHTLATNMAQMITGHEIADGLTDAMANENRYSSKKLTTKFGDGAYYRPWRGNSSRDLFSSAINGKNESHINELAQGMCNWLKSIGKANWDVNLVKEVLKAMPKNTNLDEFCDNNTGLGYAIKMDKFVKFFNQTLENMDNAAINPQAIDFASNEEMRVKSPDTLAREQKLGLEKDVNSEDFYTRPTNEEIAKTTIEGAKSQVKGLAETIYILKGVEFNNELFNSIFDSVKNDVLNGISEGGATLNNVLHKFISQFNARWVPESLSDVASKQNN